MKPMKRRTFLKRSLAAAGSTLLVQAESYGRVLGSNDVIRVGVAGLNGRGGSHLDEFSGMKGVEVACLIDPDTRTFKDRLKKLEEKGRAKPVCVQDVRKALEDKDLHVLSIATTNHWHSLMTIWACQAGKDVYVEKPLSHNLREGAVAVETARLHRRIVQHGTQSRSSNGWARAAALARSGKLGKLLVSRGLCYKNRGSIGFKEPSTPPAELDYDLWLGPASKRPHHANLVHYNWHWFWDFGNGDIGNQGVHQMDIARWCIPGATLPRRVVSLGGRFGYQDQGETPNTQIAVFDYGETQLIFEVRGLRTDKLHGQAAGNILHFEAGTVAGNDKFFPTGSDQAQPLPEVELDRKRGQGGGIFGNFIACVRSRNASELDADVLEGHHSSALCHLANISYRLGAEVPWNPRTGAFGEDRAVLETLERMEKHLSEGNGLKLDGGAYRLGRALEFDARTESILGDREAHKLLTREYRRPFVVPEGIA